MFTCAKIRDGSTYLSSHLSANDYYCEQENVTGRWMGKAAQILDLEGKTISRDDPVFEALRLNQHPDGSGKLTPRNVNKAIRFFDFQCSAQKSVSIMAVTLQDHRLYEAHDRAALKALTEVERFAAIQAGQGHGKHRETTGNLCVAAFRHDASRELDPQLHTHFVVANATWDPTRNRWLALETHDIFKAIRYCGKVYQNELARESRKLGYQIEHIRNEKGVVEGFEIRGVSQELRGRFSKRRAEVEAAIEQFVAQRGRQPTAAEIAELTRKTRSFKLKEITTPDVLARQRAQVTAEELRFLERLRNRALAGGRVELSMLVPERALAAARQHLFERRSVLAAHEILAEALNQGLGTIDLRQLKTTIVRTESLVAVGPKPAEPLQQPFATPEGIALERWAVDFVNRTKEIDQLLGPTKGLPFRFQSNEQQQAALEILACRDRVSILRGAAGAGKTTCLREIHRALETSGANLYYLAPTASAAKVLKGDGFGTATTLADFLVNRLPAEEHKLRRSVLVVDEAGLQSNQLGVAVLKAAERYGARVVFVGDSRQHVSVEAGDFLRILESHSRIHCSELKDIRRQVVQEYNLAIRGMAAGNTLEGMERLHRLGWVQEARDGYLDAAADTYLRETEGGKRLDRTIAISPTWAENFRFTDAIRARLKTAGYLSDSRQMVAHNSLNWTRRQLGDIANYRPGLVVTFNMGTAAIPAGKSLIVERIGGSQLYFHGQEKPFTPRRHAGQVTVSEQRPLEVAVGDRLLIRRNDRRAGLINGDVLTVSRIDEELTIHSREGKVVPADFRDFCHGYVVTSHKSQGRTHTSVVLAAEEVDAKAAYVACSRGRERCSVFTPDLTHFLQRLPRSGDRTAALDLEPNQTTKHSTPKSFANWWNCLRNKGDALILRLRHPETPPSVPHELLAEKALKQPRRELEHSL